MTIRVHIERLVLEGLPVERRHGPMIQQAVEAELGRLIEANGTGAFLQQGGAQDSIRGATITLGARTEWNGIGRQIAGAVFGSLKS